jgi:hypothetical protein
MLLSGISSGDLADESMEFVDSSRGWQEHKGTLAGNDLNSAFLAE